MMCRTTFHLASFGLLVVALVGCHKADASKAESARPPIPCA